MVQRRCRQAQADRDEDLASQQAKHRTERGDGTREQREERCDSRPQGRARSQERHSGASVIRPRHHKAEPEQESPIEKPCVAACGGLGIQRLEIAVLHAK